VSRSHTEPDCPEWALEELLEGVKRGLTVYQASEEAGLGPKEVVNWRPTSELGRQLDEAIKWRNEHQDDWPAWGSRYYSRRRTG
jgi:hypothetical protein